MVRQSPARPIRGRASRARPARQSNVREGDIPDVYKEMLEEAEARDPQQFHSDRPVKKRKTGATKAIPVDSAGRNERGKSETIAEDQQVVQTIYDSATEDESDLEDVEWEDVDVQPSAPSASDNAVAPHGDDETLQITLNQEPQKQKRTVQRRKPVTAAEKKLRLDVHKAHLLCLLAHVALRNRWCNDDETQRFLKRMLPKRIVALLNPDEGKPSYTRSTTFMQGLNEAADIFNRKYRVKKPGMKRAHWAEDHAQLKKRTESIMFNAEVITSKEDFCSQAKTMQGSRDFGAQLFCAVLRSVAVEARLVCSLQPLPFSGTTKDSIPHKAGSQYIVISSDDHDTSTDERQKSASGSTTPARTKRLGRPEFNAKPAQTPRPLGPLLDTRESSYPVYWVEAFNEGAQKWFPIDCMATKTVAKPYKLEPPASDPYNSMSYVVAFEDDASAKDVTRRYTKAFNAKTRKLRVDSTPNGAEWWDGALRTYAKPFVDDRDEAEISEFTSKSAAEPMPRNIQDFKDHPIYALERHLRRNEVIFPKRVIGHVGLSKNTSKSDDLETVYRRSDVHIVRSAVKWYRLGRDVKVGEQPLKHARATKPKGGLFSDEEDAEPEETALYAEYQTEKYQAPPVVQGRIPKNLYGNLDVYVPSMVPPGAVHIKMPGAARAARLLSIDYADAVTGFDFRGRRGTAIFEGVVIAQEYQEALEEALRSFATEKERVAMEERTTEVLRFWRLFLVKLRIAERVKTYATGDEGKDDVASEMSVDNVEDEGGGFLPEDDEPMQSSFERIPGNIPRKNSLSNEGGAVNTSQVPDDLEGGFMPDTLENEALSLKPSVARTGHQPSTTGGFGLDMSSTSGLGLGANTSNQPAQPIPQKRPGRMKLSQTPRYELIVVPNTTDTTTEGNQDTVDHTVSKNMAGSSDNFPISVDSSNAGSKPASVEFISRPTSPQKEPSRSPPPKESDSEIEKGSLLSEDPDDEDAIPEWLVFDD